MRTTLNNAHCAIVSLLRGGRGLYVRWPARKPEQVLELYEFEACPFCRKVREVLSEMDLAYLCHPCARGSRNRQRVLQLGGKMQVPFLVDPNTGRTMYESEDIITYLLDTYGPGRGALSRMLGPLNTLGARLASAVRPRGLRVQEAARHRPPPDKLLHLYGFEACPFCRKVREVLHELDLDFLCHNVAPGSARRPALQARGGRVQVPYLVDENTGTALYESEDIVSYLQRTYG
ncbi:MAG: glutathione S-transferase N-terminal domain-containing protein [Myxococcales bacterium]|nr:glutathione S-transferase N-terminal domain-containing protein [Myxococcota bacterium]MDW8280933.1 glutathione S-transferase N-terminal domain-containing protein [Myxococcales bacterium]